MLGYCLHVPTFITFLHFYLCNGVYFKSDPFEDNSAIRVENTVINKTIETLKHVRFVSCEPEKLAVFIVYHSRVLCGLKGWNQELEAYGKVTACEAKTLSQELEELLRPPIIPLQIHSVNIINVKEILPRHNNKIQLRELSRESLRDNRNRLTIITNNRSSLRNSHSLAVIRK